MKNYYVVLGVEKTASAQEVKQAYRTLGLRFHPDRPGNGPREEERWKEISEAYCIVGNPEKRVVYDRIMSRKTLPEATTADILNSSSDFLADLFSVKPSGHSVYRAEFDEIRPYTTAPEPFVHLATLEEPQLVNFGRGNGLWKYRHLTENKKGIGISFQTGDFFSAVRSNFNPDLIMLWPISTRTKTSPSPTQLMYDSFNVLGYDNPGRLIKVKWSQSRTVWVGNLVSHKATSTFELQLSSKRNEDFPTSFTIDWMRDGEIVLKDGPFRRMKYDRGKGSKILCWLPSIEQLYSRFLSKCRIEFGSGYAKIGPVPTSVWKG